MRKVLYIFGLLSEADVEWMARTGARLRLKDREIVIHEGTPVQSIILLLQGQFLISTRAKGEVDRRGVGEIFGEMSFVDSAPPSATVSAIGDCLALFLDKQAVAQKLAVDAAFGSRFYRALAVFLADRLRTAMRPASNGNARGSIAHDLCTPDIAKDELDEGILDSVSMAGERFDRMLKMLVGEP